MFNKYAYLEMLEILFVVLISAGVLVGIISLLVKVFGKKRHQPVNATPQNNNANKTDSYNPKVFYAKVDRIHNRYTSHGIPVHKHAISNSLRDNVPYPCISSWEYETLTGEKEPALKGYIPKIDSLIHDYSTNYFLRDVTGSFVNDDCYGVQTEKDKAQYWQNFIKKMALNENRMAQAYLACDWQILGRELFVTKQDTEYYKELYEKDLFMDANNGDPYAQHAIGRWFYHLKYSARTDWLQQASDQGLGDAILDLQSAKRLTETSDGKLIPASTTISNEEQFANWSKIAESNNGITVPYYQYQVGRVYIYGDADYKIHQDHRTALYWLNLASQNGSKSARQELEGFEEKRQESLANRIY